MIIRKVISKIFELGLKQELSFEERMGIVLTNQMNLLAVIATLTYMGGIVYAEHWLFAFFAIGGFVGYVVTFWLNANYRHGLARTATLLTAYV